MHLFDRDISYSQQGLLHVAVQITDDWSINTNPHGGYLMAILANAVIAVSEKQRLIILTASFMLRCKPGPADLYLELMGHSKSFDRYQIRLEQNGIEKIRAFATLMPELQLEDRDHEQSAPEILPLDQCIQVPEMPKYTFYQQMDVRLEPDCAGWFLGKYSDKSLQKGWVRFKDPRPFDQPAIILLADAFPPPVLAKHGVVAWVPTIEMSVNIRGLPQSDWIKAVFRSRFIDNHIVDEDGELWDQQGNLVAISRQISQFRKT